LAAVSPPRLLRATTVTAGDVAAAAARVLTRVRRPAVAGALAAAVDAAATTVCVLIVGP